MNIVEQLRKKYYDPNFGKTTIPDEIQTVDELIKWAEKERAYWRQFGNHPCFNRIIAEARAGRLIQW